VAGHPTPAPTTIQTHNGNLQGNQLEFTFNLEYALPNKNTYDYTLSLVVTDGHGIEQATVIKEIHLPRPIAMIVGYGEDLRAGGRPRYRFTGEVTVQNLLGGKSYFWAADPKGWPVANVGPTNRPDFSFEFDHQLPPRVGDFPPPGPQVTVTVTDEAGQVAKEIVDASNFVPELFRAKANAVREARSLVALLRRGPKSNHTTLAHASCHDPIQTRLSTKLTVPILYVMFSVLNSRVECPEA
jgi:hypothetical protein